MPPFELQAEVSLRRFIPREDHEARGRHIEAVYEKTFGEKIFEPRLQTIRQLASRHREQAGGFIDN